jgi:hypothetical protein
MKICDRCQAKAVDEVKFLMTQERFDLCESCKGLIVDIINGEINAPKRTDRNFRDSKNKAS